MAKWVRWCRAVSSALARVHAASELLLRRGTDEYVRGQLPEIHSIARKHLAANNPLRIRLEVILQRLAAHDLLLQNSTSDETRAQASIKAQNISEPVVIARAIDAETRETLVAVSAAAHLTYRQEYAQLRSFRNILMVSTVLLFVIAAGLGSWGYFQPHQLSLCFLPEELKKLVCPTAEIALVENTNNQAGADIDDAVKLAAQRMDVLLIQFLGLVAAAVSGAASLRRISGSSTPYSLTVALAFIKLPTGALTAVLGLMLMRGGFIPGLTALDSSAQVLAWAIVFGAAQQLVTGLVDRQAQGVLANVGGKSHNVIERPATV